MIFAMLYGYLIEYSMRVADLYFYSYFFYAPSVPTTRLSRNNCIRNLQRLAQGSAQRWVTTVHLDRIGEYLHLAWSCIGEYLHLFFYVISTNDNYTNERSMKDSGSRPIDQKSISCVFKIVDLTLQTIQKTDSVLSENLFCLSWQH